jgi:hypothetical protein
MMVCDLLRRNWPNQRGLSQIFRGDVVVNIILPFFAFDRRGAPVAMMIPSRPDKPVKGSDLGGSG